MKKVLLFLLLLLPLNCYAASGSIKATSSSSKVTLNNTVTVTVKVSSTDTLGSWQYGLSYDKSKLSLISGDTSIVGYGDGTYSSKSYTYKFRAIATGNANITIDNPKIVDWNSESAISTSKTNLTLTIKEPVIINYSSDNNLSSLEVEGFELSPTFNKSTLEYSVTVLPTTTSVNIKAKTSDSKASVKGTGNVNVVEGTNSVSVVVTAENGTAKTYILNITVPEKDPVKYTFNNEEYDILRKLPENIPLNFNRGTLTFNEEEVACLQNENLNLTLIYLRDKNNKENFYIYNDKNKSIELYNEIKNNDVTIYLLNKEIDVIGYEKKSIKINGVDINAYQLRKNSKDYLVVGRNISTGKENVYVYDVNNKIISLFNEEDYNYLMDKINLYQMIIYGSIGAGVLLLLIIILMASNKRKLTKMIKKLSVDNKSKEENAEKVKKNKKDKSNKNTEDSIN